MRQQVSLASLLDYHTTQAKQAVKTGVATCEKTAPTLTKPGQTFFGPDRLRRLWHGGHSLHCVIPQYGGFLLSVQTILKQEQYQHEDSDFLVGDTVILVVQRYAEEKKQMYGKILSKW